MEEVKLDELLERQLRIRLHKLVDNKSVLPYGNQQPSLGSNSFEGSTTRETGPLMVYDVSTSVQPRFVAGDDIV